MALGADVVGGIPWIEATAADQEAHVEWACALAARLGRRVAMLTDDAPDPRLRHHPHAGRGDAPARAGGARGGLPRAGVGHYDAAGRTRCSTWPGRWGWAW